MGGHPQPPLPAERIPLSLSEARQSKATYRFLPCERAPAVAPPLAPRIVTLTCSTLHPPFQPPSHSPSHVLVAPNRATAGRFKPVGVRLVDVPVELGEVVARRRLVRLGQHLHVQGGAEGETQQATMGGGVKQVTTGRLYEYHAGVYTMAATA